MDKADSKERVGRTESTRMGESLADADPVAKRCAKVFEFLDMSGDGKVEPEEMTDWLLTFLWIHRGRVERTGDAGESAGGAGPDRSRSGVGEHLLSAPSGDPAAGASKGDNSEAQTSTSETVHGNDELFRTAVLECARACLQPGSHVLTREDLPAVLDAVIHDERVLAALMHMESFTTAMLLLQFADVTAAATARRSQSFSFRTFLAGCLFLQVMPLCIFLAGRFPRSVPRIFTGIRQLIIHKFTYVAAQLPKFVQTAAMEKLILQSALPLLVINWIAVYACMIMWWASTGSSLRTVQGSQGFATFEDPAETVSFFEAHIPWILLQIMVVGSASKIAVRDSDHIDQLAVAVRDLGGLGRIITERKQAQEEEEGAAAAAALGSGEEDNPKAAAATSGRRADTSRADAGLAAKRSSGGGKAGADGEGGKGGGGGDGGGDNDGEDGEWSLARLLLRIKVLVLQSSSSQIIRVSLFVFPPVLALAHRLLRLGLTGTFWAMDQGAMGPAVCILCLFSMTLMLAAWWHEVADLLLFLKSQKARAEIFASLLSRVESATNGLPCMKVISHSRPIKPATFIAWARLRAYMQNPNPLQVRWLEAQLAGTIFFVMLTAILFFVTLFQGTLLASYPDHRNADVQVLVLWAVTAFGCVGCTMIMLIFTAVSGGNVYRNDLLTLQKELWKVECCCTELEDTAEGDEYGRVSAFARLSVQVRDRRLLRLKLCRNLLQQLLGVIQLSNEYITVFGIAIDKTFRNALLSAALSAVAAGVSAAVSLIHKS